MGISVTEPIGLAMSRTGLMLFKPFDIGKWFVLGFAAFLASLAEGGVNHNPNPFGGGGGPGPRGPTVPDVLEEMKQLFLRNAHWVLPIGFVLLLLWVVIVWLRARGKFIFLDGVARNYAAIVEPWSRLRAQGNSYFRFDLVLSLLMAFAALAIAIIAYTIALPDLRADVMGPAGITALVVGGGMFAGLIVAYALAQAVAEDFLIPLMYLRASRIGPAWAEFRTRILPGHVGVIALFYLMRIVLGLGFMAITMIGMCVTCCIAALPYLSSVFFLPLFVFSRTYALYFLAQFGGEYNALTELFPQQISAFPVIMNPPPPIDPAPLDAIGPPPPSIPPQGDHRDV